MTPNEWLELHIHSEEKAVEMFAATPRKRGKPLENPMETPFILLELRDQRGTRYFRTTRSG